LGEARKSEVPFSEAAASWYDNVYRPLVDVIIEQDILKDFSGRTETDLYLWIIRHQWHLRETYGEEITLHKAVQTFSNDHSTRPMNLVVKVLKKITGAKEK
jgi:hypothetical protein